MVVGSWSGDDAQSHSQPSTHNAQPLEAERIPLLPFSVYSVVNLNPQRSTHTIVNRKLINRKFYPLPTTNYHCHMAENAHALIELCGIINAHEDKP